MLQFTHLTHTVCECEHNKRMRCSFRFILCLHSGKKREWVHRYTEHGEQRPTSANGQCQKQEICMTLREAVGLGSSLGRPTHNFTAGHCVDVMVCCVVSDVWCHIRPTIDFKQRMLMVLAGQRFFPSEFFCAFYVTFMSLRLRYFRVFWLCYIVRASMYSRAKIKYWMNEWFSRSELRATATI